MEKLSLLNAAVSMDLMGLVALPKAAVTMSMCSQTLMELPGTMAGIMAPFRISLVNGPKGSTRSHLSSTTCWPIWRHWIERWRERNVKMTLLRGS